VAENKSLSNGFELQTTPSVRGNTNMKGTLRQVDNDRKNLHGNQKGTPKELSQVTETNLSESEALEAEIKALDAEIKMFEGEISESTKRQIIIMLHFPVLFVAVVLALIIHEFGHLIAALYFGWRINIFALWRFWIIKRS
jgi:hypothetical protein